jgi:hypothetical protein
VALSDDFEGLTLERIEEYISMREEEHLSLDFKRLTVPDLTNQNDKDNFATALSGFSNAIGGLIIWGVGTEKHASGKVDVAAAKLEISDLTLAVGRLNEFTGVLVSPTVDGVRHKKIETTANRGFVATIVPQSDMGPHMALAGVHAYYKRNGDRFLPMEHFEIADMFGRRRRPVLRVAYEASGGSSGNGFMEVNIDLFLENLGRGSAAAPYVDVAALGSQLSTKPHGVSFPGVGLMQPLWANSLNLFLGRGDLVIHPRVRFCFARAVWRLQTGVQNPDWRDARIVCRFAAEGAPLEEQLVIVPRTELARLLGFDATALSGAG